MAVAGPNVLGEVQVGGQEDTQSENTWPLGHTRPVEMVKGEDRTVVGFLFLVFGCLQQNFINCCRTAEVRCPPCYDDVLLGTFSGIAGQSVAHSHISLLGWQTAVQVEARVDVSFRVQLKDMTT